MGRLDGKVALITGGARGMGESHVRHFREEGAEVVFGDVLDDAGAAVAKDCGAVYVHHDVTDPGEWAKAVETAVARFGRLDVLVNNAGILLYGPIADMSLERFRAVLDVNLVGTWLGVKSVIEPMKQAGRGSIVNVSSVEGFIGAAGMSAYAASKFAVRGLTKSAARELGPFKIRVNSIHPGAVDTAMVANPDVAAHVDGEAFFRAMPTKRFAKPIEVSRVVAFLASDEASYCNGAEVVIDGGMLTGAGY
jgi:3alpha(or 20beta)-hydroxysteroid dehydrogenase